MLWFLWNGGLTCYMQKGLAFCMLRGRVSVVPLEHIVWPLYCRRFWPFTCSFFCVFCVFFNRKAGFWYADWLLVYLVSFNFLFCFVSLLPSRLCVLLL